jgi:hypothetical protein
VVYLLFLVEMLIDLVIFWLVARSANDVGPFSYLEFVCSQFHRIGEILLILLKLEFYI